jgi:hypothetical protein
MATSVVLGKKVEEVPTLKDRDYSVGDYLLSPEGDVYGVAYRESGSGKTVFLVKKPSYTWDTIPSPTGKGWRVLKDGETFTVTI